MLVVGRIVGGMCCLLSGLAAVQSPGLSVTRFWISPLVTPEDYTLPVVLQATIALSPGPFDVYAMSFFDRFAWQAEAKEPL